MRNPCIRKPAPRYNRTGWCAGSIWISAVSAPESAARQRSISLPGPETAVFGCQAPCAPIQTRHTDPSYYGKRVNAPGGPGPRVRAVDNRGAEHLAEVLRVHPRRLGLHALQEAHQLHLPAIKYITRTAHSEASSERYWL
jgi:hypothetical protein